MCINPQLQTFLIMIYKQVHYLMKGDRLVARWVGICQGSKVKLHVCLPSGLYLYFYICACIDKGFLKIVMHHERFLKRVQNKFSQY